MTPFQRNRRRFMGQSLALGAGGIVAAGTFGKLWTQVDADLVQKVLDAGDSLNRSIEKTLMPHLPLAREFPDSAISKHFPSLGGYGASYVEKDPAFERSAAMGFSDWSLRIDGLVERELSFTLAEIRALPRISTTTMHACEEGWTAIGKWTGVPLSHLMLRAGVRPEAKHAVFHAMDRIAGKAMFGSLDLARCLHPQTLLAFELNGDPLPVRNGAPLRLRSALDIGYKQVKHLSRISFVSDLAETDGGKGGLFEIYGYQSYGGL